MPNQNQMQMPEIRNEADLAVFNQFMMSLGRDASGHVPHAMAHGASYDSNSGSSSSPLSTESPIEDLFNPEELASLGLSGMPGIPSASLPDISLNGSSNNAFGHMYPSLSGLDMPRQRATSSSDVDLSKRPIAGLPRSHSVANKGTSSSTMPMYNLGPNPYPELPTFDHPLGEFNNPLPNDYSSFDSLARSSKDPMPAATMAPRDFYKKTYRHVAPLGAAVSSRQSSLLERQSSERTEMDDDEDERSSSEDMQTPKISVRSLLVNDADIDPSLRLPAIDRRPEAAHDLPSLHDTHLDVYTSASRAGAAGPAGPADPYHAPAKRHTDDDITGGVKRLELADREYSSSRSPELIDPPARRTPAQAQGDHVKELRKRHTALIKSWIVAVNVGFQRRQAEAAARMMDERDDEDEDEDEDRDEEEEKDELATPIIPKLEIMA